VNKKVNILIKERINKNIKEMIDRTNKNIYDCKIIQQNISMMSIIKETITISVMFYIAPLRMKVLCINNYYIGLDLKYNRLS